MSQWMISPDPAMCFFEVTGSLVDETETAQIVIGQIALNSAGGAAPPAPPAATRDSFKAFQLGAPF